MIPCPECGGLTWHEYACPVPEVVTPETTPRHGDTGGRLLSDDEIRETERGRGHRL